MEITKQFIEVNKKICKYLDCETSKINFKVLFQGKESAYEIPELGKKFGIIYDEKGNLILAKWLQAQSTKEKEYLTEFLLIREGFREIFKQDITVENPYERLTDIIMQILALLWFCEQKKIPFNSSPMITIRRRADAYEENDILQSKYWVFFFTNCHQQNLNSNKLYPVFIERVKDALVEEKPIEKLAWDIMYWLKAHLPEEESDLLPIYIEKKRHYKVIKALGQGTYEDGSALNLSKKLGRSHNTVNRDYQQIMDKYDIYWYPKINFMMLRLYPYFFRVNFKDKETREKLIEKLLANRYVRFIRECEIQEKTLLIGWMESPLITYEQIAEYLERLKRKDLIKDYFIKQIRRKRITWTITTKKMEPTEETYQALLTKPNELENYTLTAFDEKYDITDFHKEKKEVYHKDLLLYISTLLHHHLGKTYYRFRPIETIYELLEKKGLDISNTTEVLYHISQIDVRCRRLGLFDYCLYFQEHYLVKIGLYIEIAEKSNKELKEKIIKTLENLGEMLRMDLMERVVLIFPYVKYDSLIRKMIEKLMKESNLDFEILQMNYIRKLQVLNTDYVDAYDFELEQWKID